MPKSIILGNGNILVNLDFKGRVADLYFPYIDREDQIGQFVHKIGVFVDGQFSWFDSPEWQIAVNYRKSTLASDIKCVNQRMGLEINFCDIVYNEKNIFLREVKVKNNFNRGRKVKIFFNQPFYAYGIKYGNTVFYDPETESIIHYRGRRVFLISGQHQGKSFDEFSTGVFQYRDKQGTYKDAEDGILSGNPIQHGSVDSTIGFSLYLDANQSTKFYYWIAIAKTLNDVRNLHYYILNRSPEHLMETTQDFWRAWLNKTEIDFNGLDPKLVELFKKSLLIIRVHTDKGGAIIASGDSGILRYGADTYNYCWPRDASFAAMVLDNAGYSNVSRQFFEFCNQVITSDGYLFPKYLADKSLGSSWHPWIENHQSRLPIQEDETALVLYVLWNHYLKAKDLEFIESIYNSLIKRAADFILKFRDPITLLPKPSYDLWEEKYGISTFTSSACYGALISASNFARVLGKQWDEKRYKDGAKRLKSAILKYLYNPKENSFYRMIQIGQGKILHDETLDISSIYGPFRFGILDVNDLKLEKMFKKAEQELNSGTEIGGIVRFKGDTYFREDRLTPGNPWFITTLWLAQYYIAKAKSKTELDKAKHWLDWTLKHSLPSGVLPEQIDCFTGKPLSVAPLVWSHAEFAHTVIKFLDKLKQFK